MYIKIAEHEKTFKCLKFLPAMVYRSMQLIKLINVRIATAHHCALVIWFGEDLMCSDFMFEIDEDLNTGVAPPDGDIPPEKELAADK